MGLFVRLPSLLHVLLLVAAVRVAALESGAVPVVDGLHKAYLEVLHEAEALGYSGRYAKLAPVIAASFDSEFMAQAAIGRAWKALDDKDRARWVESFRAFTTANYAARLDHDAGQRFEILGEEPAAAGTVAVRARVTDPGAEDVALTYRLRQTDGQWRVVDIYANGTVSEVALRRSEYSTVLKEKGLEGLIALVQGKIDDLAAGKVVN
jgi:phospholipid transport system substrate-binding protein